MKAIYCFGVLFLIQFLSAVTCLDDKLIEKLETITEDKFIQVNMFLKEKADFMEILEQGEKLPHTEQKEYAVQKLKSFYATSQEQLMTILEMKELENQVKNIRPLWITNVIRCEIKKNVLLELSNHESLFSITEDVLYQSKLPKQKLDVLKRNRNRVTQENISQINAPDVWEMGYTGYGVLVAVVDTGVNYNHSDLQGHLWEHPDYPNHGYDFHNDDNDPIDDHGHGTTCAGFVAGDGTSGVNTGVAPDATIMAVKVSAYNFDWHISNHWLGIQFAVEHGADIITLSNAIYAYHEPVANRIAYRQVWENVLAAGAIGCMPSGNAGNEQNEFPVPNNITMGGDCPAPWSHPDQGPGSVAGLVCVGAVERDDDIAPFSSIGPVTWQNVEGYNDYPYNPGHGLIKPDLVAPGHNLTSLSFESNTDYVGGAGYSGTSNSTPHVAGLFALMLSKNIDLSPADLDQIAEQNAEHLTETKSNIFGSGRIDALETIEAVPENNLPPNPCVNPFPAVNAQNIQRSQKLHWFNDGLTTSYELSLGTDNPPTNILNRVSLSEPAYQLSTELDYETTYYWCVKAINSNGEVMGDAWTFTTINQPLLEVNQVSIQKTIGVGEMTQETIAIQNLGGNSLSYVVQLRNETTNGNREIEQAFMECRTSSYISGETTPLIFDVHNHSTNNEAISNIMLSFPMEMDVASVTDMIGTGGAPLGYNSNTSNNSILYWDGLDENGNGVLASGSSRTGAIALIFDEETTDPFEMTYTLTGDEGSSKSGNIRLYNKSLGWMSLNHNTGSLDTNEIDYITLTLGSSELEEGLYEADIIIEGNYDNQVTIPVSLQVSNVEILDNSVAVQSNLTCFPNPFNPQTTIQFQTFQREHVEVSIYNLKGQRVKLIDQKILESGTHKYVWNGKDEGQKAVSSSIYYVRLKYSNVEEICRIILLK